MSRRRDLQKKLESLKEIEDIMTAMKHLAFMETRKLSAFISAQQFAVRTIERAAGDFTHFYAIDAGKKKLTEIALLIGSERGLCGDYNERLLEAADPAFPFVSIGSRLEAARENRLILIEGPTVAEDVEQVMTEIVDYLAMLQSQLPENEALGITTYYHSDETHGVRKRRLLPLPQSQTAVSFSHEPHLDLDPAQFYEKLSEHYLYAALHEALYSALMVENKYRLDHMEHAIGQLDKRIEKLDQRCNLLRQEEITEEIEVIMLSVEALAD